MTTEVSPSQALAADTGFPGILLGETPDALRLREQAPGYFTDLNLDQLFDSVVSGRAEYDLISFFRTPLTSPEAVEYRHEIVRDLRDSGIDSSIDDFADQMRSVRKQREQAAKFHYPVQRQAQHLAACRTYLQAVRRLHGALADAPVRSHGLTSLRAYLDAYVGSEEFSRMEADVADVRERLAGVRYRIHIIGDRLEVSLPLDEEDYAADVARTFARFRQGRVDSHASKLKSFVEMNHVEAAVTDMVARLDPDAFTALKEFERRHHDFLDETVTTFDREVQFYLAYLEFVARLERAGLAFCLPDVVVDDTTRLGADDAFDAALAGKLVSEGQTVVTNDFSLTEGERILVVTGPNQGGKTTFARMVGQLHHLTALGLPVPGRRATLQLVDGIFTHFEQGENLGDLSGKLEDDIVRVRDILDQATARSLLVVNEIFTSTSLEDAVVLATRVLERVTDLGSLCVCVTFLDELSDLGPATVSMVSDIDPEDPVTRTFKIRRRQADGLAYAEALAQKYRVTYPCLKERLGR
jgi:DNA mismatch repair protein MutS